MLAPGDGEAEPGESNPTDVEPTSGRKIRNTPISSTRIHLLLSVASFAGSMKSVERYPRLGFAFAWASTLSACFAGWLLQMQRASAPFSVNH